MATVITQNISGETKTTIQITTSNTAKALIHADNLASLLDSDGKLIQSCLITCETYDVRFAFNATPVSSGLGHLLYVGQSIQIDNPRSLADFKYISAVAGSHGVLMVTPLLRPE